MIMLWPGAACRGMLIATVAFGGRVIPCPIGGIHDRRDDLQLGTYLAGHLDVRALARSWSQ
jgi:hypothetical protein